MPTRKKTKSKDPNYDRTKVMAEVQQLLTKTMTPQRAAGVLRRERKRGGQA